MAKIIGLYWCELVLMLRCGLPFIDLLDVAIKKVNALVMSRNYRVQSRQLLFPGHSGYALAATLDYPEGAEPLEYAVMSHCFTCTRQTLTTARLSRGLARNGIAILRFDFTGLGDSEGVFAETHFRSMIEDIVCASEFLTKHYRSPSLLLGHSMGGTASLAASQLANTSLNAVKRVITLASPASPAHVLHHFGSAMSLLEQGEDAEIRVAGRTYPVKPSFVEDVGSYDMSKQMTGFNLEVLAARAGEDELVGPEAAEQILAYTQGDQCLVDIDGADHLFSNRDHATQLEQAVLNWLGD